MLSDFNLIADQMHDGLYLLDLERRITYWNRAAERITGYRAEEVIGKRCSDNILVHVDSQGRELCSRLCPAGATMVDGSNRQAELYLKHKDGHRVPVSVRVSPLRDEQGKIIGGIELFAQTNTRDDLQSRLRKLERLALLDDLTQLPNRRYLETELESQFNMHDRKGVPFSILLVDIDHFKQVNDRYGHQVGDLVLKSLAKSMSGVTRSFDTIGRWGGEEFLGIFPNTEKEDLKVVAEKIHTVARYTQVPNNKLRVSVTIGCAVVRSSEDKTSLIQRADEALYQGKETGRGKWIISE